jgi:hypothetical protein
MRGLRATLLRRIERLERSGCGIGGPWLVINGYVDGGEAATLFVGFVDGRPTLTGEAAAEWGKANGEPADVEKNVQIEDE